MKTASLATLKLELEEACAALRSFTLGRSGVTQQDGFAGIRRVNAQCDRLKKLFATGPDASRAAQVEARGRACIRAAEARFAVLGHDLVTDPTA